jgi:hypothetical protein
MKNGMERLLGILLLFLFSCQSNNETKTVHKSITSKHDSKKPISQDSLFKLQLNFDENFVQIFPPKISKNVVPAEYPNQDQEWIRIYEFEANRDFNGDQKNDVIVCFGGCGSGGCLYGVFIKQYGSYYRLAFFDYLKNKEYEIEKNGCLKIVSSEELNPYDPSQLQISSFQYDKRKHAYQLDTSYVFSDQTDDLEFSTVLKDLDHDGVKDSCIYNPNRSVLTCKLSSQHFKSMRSKSNLTDEWNSGIRATKNGFEFYVNYMRAGFSHQFQYNGQTKKIRLIGMNRYEFGNAANDGSGKSSVNLLTNDYMGEWNYYNLDRQKLIKMGTIRTKMYFPKVTLENYDGGFQSDYAEKCSTLYENKKQKMMEQED